MRVRNDAKGELPTLKGARSLIALQIDSGMNQRSDRGCNDCSRDFTDCQSKRFAVPVWGILLGGGRADLKNEVNLFVETVDEFGLDRNRNETFTLSLVGPPDTTSSTSSLSCGFHVPTHFLCVFAAKRLTRGLQWASARESRLAGLGLAFVLPGNGVAKLSPPAARCCQSNPFSSGAICPLTPAMQREFQ